MKRSWLKYLVYGVVVCLMAFATSAATIKLLTAPDKAPSNESKFYENVISDEVSVAQLDEEFASFIGEGHRISEYCYNKILPEASYAAFGMGPLSAYREFEVIIGKSGSIGIVAYCVYDRDENIWLYHPHLLSDSITTVFLLEDCVAPEAWWDHPVMQGVFINASDGSVARTVTPWNDGEDFDNPTENYASQKYPWYWNGENYIEMTPDVAQIEKTPYGTTGQPV